MTSIDKGKNRDHSVDNRQQAKSAQHEQARVEENMQMEENLWATLHRYRSLYLAKDISFLQTHSKNISTPPGYHVRDVLLSNIVFSHSYNFVALFSLTRLLYVLVQVNRGSQWVTNFQAQKIRAPAHCRTLRISKQD